MSDTQKLIDFSLGLNWADLGAETRHAALRHLTDTVGVMVAGAATDTVEQVVGVFAGANNASAIPGRVEMASISDAAYIAGVASHGIELDDGHREGSSHPGTVVIPAALVLAAENAVTGERLLESVIAGYEAAIAIARAAHPRFRERGFHPTSVAGVIGSAIAGSRILDLDETRTSNALGIAASNAGGLYAFVNGGSDVKRLHAGNAAAAGVRAALLAQAGVEGPPEVIEARSGLAEGFAGGFPHDLDVAQGGRMGIRDCYIKPYPCCRHIQPAAEAIFALRAEHGFEPRHIDAISVDTYALGARHAEPHWRTFASAQLSYPYICAVAARDGAITMASFDESNRSDPLLNNLAAKVKVQVADDMEDAYPTNRPARVTITTEAAEFTRTALEALGSDQIPLDDDGLRDKFAMLTEPVLGTTRAAALLTSLWTAASIPDTAELLAATVPR